MKTQGLFSRSVLGLGFAFLYVPILSMVVYSFNDSRSVTVWNSVTSPTVKWYGKLFGDEQILAAAWLSIRVAAMSASGAVVLGTLAGLVLARFGPFKGRALLQGLTTAPLVMPEVITGLSMLLVFKFLEELTGWPSGQGLTTVIEKIDAADKARADAERAAAAAKKSS